MMSLWLLTAPLQARPMPKNRVCNGSRNLVGDCFLVHGRLRTYNGIAFRIGVIGTGHMLGKDDEDRMRSKVAKEQTFGSNYFADFEVCPFTKQREGELQIVCMQSASHVVIVDHRPEDEGKLPILRKVNGRIED